MPTRDRYMFANKARNCVKLWYTYIMWYLKIYIKCMKQRLTCTVTTTAIENSNIIKH